MMNLNEPLSIRRVANGFVVEPTSAYFSKESDRHDLEVYVFPTLAALVAWLLEHYPQPEPEAAAPSPLYYIQRNLTNTYYAGGITNNTTWTKNKSGAYDYTNEKQVNHIAESLRREGYSVQIVDEHGHVPYIA